MKEARIAMVGLGIKYKLSNAVTGHTARRMQPASLAGTANLAHCKRDGA